VYCHTSTLSITVDELSNPSSVRRNRSSIVVTSLVQKKLNCGYAINELLFIQSAYSLFNFRFIFSCGLVMLIKYIPPAYLLISRLMLLFPGTESEGVCVYAALGKAFISASFMLPTFLSIL
jgi:hypothetical protein